MEEKGPNPGSESLTQTPLKRKSDLVPAEEGEENRATKQQKPDAPIEELGDAGEDEKKEGANQNANADEEQWSPIRSPLDKGKMKMVEDSGEEDKDESGCSGDDDDVEKFLSDESLTVIEAENILPERTRPPDSLKHVSTVREGKNDDDKNDRDYCQDEEVMEEEREKQDDEGEKVKEKEQQRWVVGEEQKEEDYDAEDEEMEEEQEKQDDEGEKEEEKKEQEDQEKEQKQEVEKQEKIK